MQLIDGVVPGENVITVGGLGLQDGTKVLIEKPSRPRKDEQKAE